MGTDNKPVLPSGGALDASASPIYLDSQAKQRRVLGAILALICSNVFSLFVGGIYEYLSLRGVVNVHAARYVLLFC